MGLAAIGTVRAANEGVDLERGGDVDLAGAFDEPDAERRPAPWCEGGEEVGEVTWRRPLRGDAGGAVQRPARVGQLAAHPLRLGGAGELLDQPQGAEHARGHPGGGGDLAVLDVALAAHPVHLRAAALQAPDASTSGRWPGGRRAGPRRPAAATRRRRRAGARPGRPGGRATRAAAPVSCPPGRLRPGSRPRRVRVPCPRPRRRANSRAPRPARPRASRPGGRTPCTRRTRRAGEDLIRPERIGDDRAAGAEHHRDGQTACGTGLGGGQPSAGRPGRPRVGRPHRHQRPGGTGPRHGGTGQPCPAQAAGEAARPGGTASGRPVISGAVTSRLPRVCPRPSSCPLRHGTGAPHRLLRSRRYAAARAAALYGGAAWQPIGRSALLHLCAAAIRSARKAASFRTQPSSAEVRVCCQVRPSM